MEDFSYVDYLLNVISVGVLVSDDRANVIRFNEFAKPFLEDYEKNVWVVQARGDSLHGSCVRSARIILEKMIKRESNINAIYTLRNMKKGLVYNLTWNKLVKEPGIQAYVFLLHSKKHHLTPVGSRLAQHFEMTKTEARITLFLVEGKSVGEIAQSLSVQENTVRIHLKHIYDKVGARGQSDLVRQILGNVLLCMSDTVVDENITNLVDLK